MDETIIFNEEETPVMEPIILFTRLNMLTQMPSRNTLLFEYAMTMFLGGIWHGSYSMIHTGILSVKRIDS